MSIPTEPIGSIPRPQSLLDVMAAAAAGAASPGALDAAYEAALRDTITRFEATGSPVVSDGEQTKPSFVTYPLHGIETLAPDGLTISFADGHTRQLPRLTRGPFRYGVHAGQFVAAARRYARVPVKQAVISASALSLLYPGDGIDGYPHRDFITDLRREAHADIRSALDAGAHRVQIDFTEARLSLKLDPSGGILDQFIALNNSVLEGFSDDERQRLGVHSCPGGDRDSTHSADVDYADLIPRLFGLRVTSFYLQLASERDRGRVLALVREHLRPGQRVFVGVTDPIDPAVETPEIVCERVLEAAAVIPVAQLGTTDDCGFAPFADDGSTARETAFAKIRARVVGTALAADALGLGRGLRAGA
jgi:5-methyltetrahydropteroyltriglutamate--homocysteine methyltransferase